jgi:hypothetical protein
MSASEFARQARINYTTYAHHENGRREILPSAARLYAGLLEVPVSKLLYGDELEDVPPVPVTACLTTQGRVKKIVNRNGKPTLVTFPDLSELVGFEIVDNEFYPAYAQGDLVCHRPLRKNSRYDTSRISGVECVVQLEDGTTLLRHVTIQDNGRVTLNSYKAAPLINQQIIAAEPVEVVLRKAGRRRTNR